MITTDQREEVSRPQGNGCDVGAYEYAAMDFGDAPATYPTLQADQGARHLSTLATYFGPTVGGEPDADSDGRPTAGADGDDDDGDDDEDGISLPDPLLLGPPVNIGIEVGGGAGRVDAWIDLDQDGDWDAADQIIADLPLEVGSHVVAVPVPATALEGSTYARFRISEQGGLSPMGPASSGEVEDYLVSIIAMDLTATKSNNVLGATTVGNSWIWTITVANGGNAAATFTSGQTLFSDSLPSTDISYGATSVANQRNVTGIISCSIVSSDLTCTASGGNVAIGAHNGSFVVQLVATPTATGTFANPHESGSCAVDPRGVVTESNEDNNACSDSVAVTAPELVAAKSNDVDGATTLGNSWIWTITVQNDGDAAGTFTRGRTIFRDQLPDADISYGMVSVSDVVNITGAHNISCTIESATLSRVAGGADVTIGAGDGSFALQFVATAGAVGTFDNPREDGSCAVDPDSVVAESDEENNACSDTVVVAEAPHCGDGDCAEDESTITCPQDCGSACGDGMAFGQEVCDGTDLRGMSCQALGFAEGTLKCADGCDGFDLSGCMRCGDGRCDETETTVTCPTDCGALCGDGVLFGGEECDDGVDNSDTEPDACRTSCVVPLCGDGVVDTGETCDDGEDNSDTEADACRTNCAPSSCGDGVLDEEEECDQGTDNSDWRPDGCRDNCANAHCGDGVSDSDEACDDGADNADGRPDACRRNCSLPSCGDGVRDTGEACDDGELNSDTQPDSCRTDCSLPRCGDSVVDPGNAEQCDDGQDNSDATPNACRANCTLPICGDGVVDEGESCDEGAANGLGFKAVCSRTCGHKEYAVRGGPDCSFSSTADRLPHGLAGLLLLIMLLGLRRRRTG